MRRFLLGFILIIVVVSGVIFSAGYTLAKTAVFAPDSLFFPLQDNAEQFRINSTTSVVERFNLQMEVCNRRLQDLTELAQTVSETKAMTAFSTAVDRLITLYAQFDPADTQNVADGRMVIIDLLNRSDVVMAQLNDYGVSDTARLNALMVKLSTLRSVTSNDQKNPKDVQQAVAPLSLLAATPGTVLTQINSVIHNVTPHIILFPPGSAGARHLFYPLIGKHASLDCQKCHPNGIYAGTAATCVSCHEKVLPVNHFPGDCKMCHTPEGWKPAHFDHQANNAQDCLTCHKPDRPANHFDGQCSLCHSTSAWKPAEFNHQGVTSCAGCHETNRPAGHFSGDCSACHSTSAWKPATFSHSTANATDCQSCHTKDKPANHFNGQCSLCHNTSAWKPANFNHEAAGASNCTSCHEAKRPAGHYAGECGACHTTNAWLPANFNHSAAGATDCRSCHAQKAPAGHYSGQCSACHNTSGWLPANFNHSAAGATDCRSCHAQNAPAGHYSAQCSACHNTSAWLPANFNHSAAGATDCQSCHARPSPHFGGQCSDCHNTDSWSNVNFNHSFPTNHGNANSCSSCHPSLTSDWTCYGCHNESELIKNHNEKNIADIGGRCMECHPDGRNP